MLSYGYQSSVPPVLGIVSCIYKSDLGGLTFTISEDNGQR